MAHIQATGFYKVGEVLGNPDAYWTITSRGDGSGVALLAIQTSSNCNIYLDGEARFYSDSAGTLNESSSWVCTSGALRTRYVKCPSGTANLIIDKPSLLIKFGNAYDYMGYTERGWRGAAVTITNTPLLNINNLTKDYYPNVINICGRGVAAILSYTISTENIPRSVEFFQVDTGGVVSGDIANMPSTVKVFTVYGTTAPNTLSGDVGDLPAVLESLYVDNSNTITGDVAGLPAGMTRVYLSGSNTVSGDIGDMPSSLLYLLIFGNNTISGNVAGITFQASDFYLSGSNTITGDIGDLPSSAMNNFVVQGNNTLSGLLDNIPAVVGQLNISGANTVSGGFSGLTATLYYLYIAGNNTISDDIANLDVRQSTILGANTIYGVLSDVSANIQTLIIDGDNTISGDIAGTVTGLYYLDIRGNNTISDYSSAGKTWNAYQNRLIIIPVGSSGGLSSAEIDQLFIDIDADCAFTSYHKIITLTGTNAAPTATSAAARASLAAKGVTITTN